jgi:glycosyltransferase involved in cell wall biosynthesis
MTPAPRVCVAMATLEGAAWVAGQLESIARQTQPPDEVVVCDDDSSDDTCEKVEAFARSARFEVRLERNPQRLGTTKNFERAVSLCHGDIIFLADQDDVWHPEKIAKLVGELNADPRAGAVFCNAEVVDRDLRALEYDLWQSLGFDDAERDMVRAGRAVEVFLRHVVAAGTTLAFRARYRELLLPFPDLRTSHDAWVAFLIAAVSDIRLCEQTLVRYRLHDANQVGIKKLSLTEQIAKAREQLAYDAFSYAAEFFGAARQRLAGSDDPSWAASQHTLDLIESKIEHSRRRAGMSANLLKRMPAILSETFKGRYWSYSYGIKSIAQDIWLR